MGDAKRVLPVSLPVSAMRATAFPLTTNVTDACMSVHASQAETAPAVGVSAVANPDGHSSSTVATNGPNGVRMNAAAAAATQVRDARTTCTLMEQAGTAADPITLLDEDGEDESWTTIGSSSCSQTIGGRRKPAAYSCTSTGGVQNSVHDCKATVVDTTGTGYSRAVGPQKNLTVIPDISRDVTAVPQVTLVSNGNSTLISPLFSDKKEINGDATAMCSKNAGSVTDVQEARARHVLRTTIQDQSQIHDVILQQSTDHNHVQSDDHHAGDADAHEHTQEHAPMSSFTTSKPGAPTSASEKSAMSNDVTPITGAQQHAVPSLFTHSRALASADVSHTESMRVPDVVVNNMDAVHVSACEQASGAGPRRMAAYQPIGSRTRALCARLATFSCHWQRRRMRQASAHLQRKWTTQSRFVTITIRCHRAS